MDYPRISIALRGLFAASILLLGPLAHANDPRPPERPDEKLFTACAAKAPPHQDPTTRSAFVKTCVAGAKAKAAEAVLRKTCGEQAPKQLEMTARWAYIDRCVADAQLHDSCAASAPADLEMSSRHEYIDTCVADAKLRDGCAAKAPANLEMSSRHEYIDSCVEDGRRAAAKRAGASNSR